jgi:hypothetical protein
MPRAVGRKKEFTERVLAPFRDGTLARIAAALAGDEDRTAFIRQAVETELRRRERKKAAPTPAKGPRRL